jgi:uncharacterized DUF497 family protein
MPEKERVPDHLDFRKAHRGAPPNEPARPDAGWIDLSGGGGKAIPVAAPRSPPASAQLTQYFLWAYKFQVRITYDPAKRQATLTERGLDFADAAKVFGGVTLTLLDDRRDYGEPRYQTYGLLGRRLVMVVWTPRGADRHVISMRKCNAREKAHFEAELR